MEDTYKCDFFHNLCPSRILNSSVKPDRGPANLVGLELEVSTESVDSVELEVSTESVDSVEFVDSLASST